ncbi:MAG: aminoacyl-tRNA hydrolase [Firmicutes bacterium]|nr:aminoacyl-tRNA hydrolase [Bacillota bacterium]
MSFFKKPGPPRWIIAGLGNPGRQYEYNRHNAGFLCLDVLADERRCKIDRLKFHALTGITDIAGQRCLLCKPNTYMNKSGEAVGECARFYQIPPERVLVVCDDVSFPPGVLRIRRKGSSGGQKGVKSIIEHLGTEEFSRIKLGVGNKPHPDYDIADWVLSNMNTDELKALRAACGGACKAIELIVAGEIEQAMAKYSH